MKKKYIAIFVLYFLIAPLENLLGQCENNINTITTNPAVTGGFDWRNQTINVYLHNEDNNTDNFTLIPNPYYLFSDNLNCGPLEMEGPNGVDYRDYQPSDGWELVYKDFGDASIPRGAVNPLFILYNRFTGVLRVFVSITERKADYNGAVVKLSIADDGTHRFPALLSYATPISNTLDNFNKKANFSKINQWINEDYYWLYAEFPLSYDPCTCYYSSMLQVTVHLKETGDLSLNTNGTLTNMVANGQTNGSDANTFSTVVGAVNDGAEAGIKGYEDAEKAIKNTKKLIGKFDSTILKKVPDWVEKIPYMGAVIGAAEFFIGLGKKQEDASPQPIISTLELTTTGTLKFDNPFKSQLFVNPGAQKGSAPSSAVPIYNNVLGVFNLLETPKIEYVSYKPDVRMVFFSQYLKSNFLGVGLMENEAAAVMGGATTTMMPSIREYKLKENLKYVLNPAANLDLIDMQVAFVYKDPLSINGINNSMDIRVENKYINGPVEIGPYNTSLNFTDRLLRSNIQLYKWPDTTNNVISSAYFNTPFVSNECFSNSRFKLFQYPGSEHEIYVKIVLTLKPKNDPNAKEVVMGLTYPVQTPTSSTLNNSNLTYYFGNLTNRGFYDCHCQICLSYLIDPACYDKVNQDLAFLYFDDWGTKYVPPFFTITGIDASPYGQEVFVNKYLDGELCGNYYAANNIIVNNGATIKPGCNVTLTAGNQVIVNANFTGNPEFIAQTGVPIPGYSCSPSKLPTASSVMIQTYCNSLTYKALSSPNKMASGDLQADADSQSMLNESSLNFIEVSPNPFSDLTDIKYSIAVSDNVNIFITNMLGQKIMEVENSYKEEGDYLIKLPANNLESGIYFCTLQSSGVQKTVRILVVK